MLECKSLYDSKFLIKLLNKTMRKLESMLVLDCKAFSFFVLWVSQNTTIIITWYIEQFTTEWWATWSRCQAAVLRCNALSPTFNRPWWTLSQETPSRRWLATAMSRVVGISYILPQNNLIGSWVLTWKH